MTVAYLVVQFEGCVSSSGSWDEEMRRERIKETPDKI